MEIFGYMAAVLMGITLGMIGGGGAILTVPILVYLFRIDPIQATGYSLFIVGSASLVGATRYARQGLIDFPTALNFAGPSFLGVYAARRLLVPALPDPVFTAGGFVLSKSHLLMLTFALLMVAASFSMIIKRQPKVQNPGAEAPRASVRWLIALQGLAIGLIAGFVGAGGGFLIIPGLVVLLGLPMKRAVPTSLFIIGVQSLLGFIGEWQQNPAMNWGFLLQMTGIALLGIVLGTSMQKLVADTHLRKGFGWFVLAVGLTIITQQILAH